MSAEAAGARAASPGPPERALKLGWLKKQRSIVKNWQQRYFVLRGQQLYYYKDEDEVKPQGCLSLQGSTIKEVVSSPEEGGKFIFEIIPGASGEHSWAGQDSCVLMANTQAEMEEWVKSIRRALGSSSGAVFGQHLAETMAQEQKFGQQQVVPILVQKCAEFILEHGLGEEGIFRLPGQDTLVKQLRDAFDAGQRPSFDRDTDVHTVASLLKLYLRELPEPVVPWLQYEEFLLCGQALDADESKGHQELLKQLSLLPRDNYNLLSYICRFLHEIQLNSSVNKMSVDNLATVIGVNLIRPQIEDPAIIMRGTPRIQKVMTVMISDHAELFPPSKDVPLSPPAPQHDKRAPVPRSSVGWGAAEDPAVPRAESSIQRQTRGDPSSRSVPGPAVSSNAPGEENRSKDTLGLWKMQPRKRTQTLPNRRTLLAAAPAGEQGSSAKSDSWKSCPGSSVHSVVPEGHKRTLSHDLFKLLDLHRTSSHDSSPQAESAEGSSSSPSPSSFDKEFLPCPSPTHQPKEMPSPTSSPTDQESKEFLQSIIKKLEKEMEAQKNDYEEQMKSLEKENYEVWAKVVKLNQELEKEKKKSEELELRLLDLERSREDMERTNKRLEEEVQKLSKPMSKADAKSN
ncbi:rho GTPase-activating protein 25 [Pogoniulus pusillus]|uniref:rho GTPase-activating protein 25 n=1 Tax=Pogoniulus pusillus TaxID=488313 RepID=UPI0030B9AC8E